MGPEDEDDLFPDFDHLLDQVESDEDDEAFGTLDEADLALISTPKKTPDTGARKTRKRR